MSEAAYKNIIIPGREDKLALGELVDAFKKALYAKLSPEAVTHMWLFGSYARGEQTEVSDIDLCVIYDDKKIAEVDAFPLVSDASYEIDNMYGVDLGTVCFSNAFYEQKRNSSMLFRDIAREGINC